MSNLNIRARGLLDFAIQSVEEGLKDPTTKNECFAEADHAVGILKKMLLKEDEFQMVRLALMSIFDISFVGTSENDKDVEKQFLEDALLGFDVGIERRSLAKRTGQGLCNQLNLSGRS